MSRLDTANKPTLSFFFLVTLILGTILSIRNWPIMVEYGFSSIVYLLIVTLIFFVPVSLVSAELISSLPEKGGIYTWVKRALGEKAAFTAVWFFWLSNVVWFPTVLSFIISILSYSLFPSLSSTYTVAIMLILFWGVSFGNFFGIRYSGWFGAFTLIFGTLLPGAVLVGFGIIWIMSGNQSLIDFSLRSLIPHHVCFRDIIFVFGLISSFCGMEMNAFHALEVENPKKNFPRAIFISGIVIVILTLLGVLSIGMVVPKCNVQLTTAVIEAISKYLEHYHAQWLLPLFSFMIAFGALGGLSNWQVGVSKGFHHVVENTIFSHMLSKVNRRGVPARIMLLQALIVSILLCIFFAMPSINSAFWLLLVLSSQLYLITYVLMFICCIILRFKKSDTHGSYQISNGKWGTILVSGIGLLASLFAFVMGFIPPSQMEVGNIYFYEGFLFLGIMISAMIPFLILKQNVLHAQTESSS